MNLLEALILGIVEGLTEFLPISSTGHLTIVEKLLGLQVNDPGVTAFTALIQMGAIAAVVVFFRRDIAGLVRAWFAGLRDRSQRAAHDYHLAWYVIVGSIPVGLVGFFSRELIHGPLRNLWVVAAGLALWSIFMYAAERVATQARGQDDLRMVDAVVIGVVQCVALIPGVSRSGATISAGLFRGIDRVTATRLSFYLSIPALVAAGIYEGVSSVEAITASVGWGMTGVATLASFTVAYASIAWLLRLVAHHPITVFLGYRVLLAGALVVALSTGVLEAT